MIPVLLMSPIVFCTCKLVAAIDQQLEKEESASKEIGLLGVDYCD